MQFWTAKAECKALGGQLLLLNNTQEVAKAIGKTMVGNVESDYRIDGWSIGQWFEGPGQAQREEIKNEKSSFLNAMKAMTLTMNLEDGSVLSSQHVDSRIGAICQGPSGVGKDQGDCQSKGKHIAFFILANTSLHSRSQEYTRRIFEGHRFCLLPELYPVNR